MTLWIAVPQDQRKKATTALIDAEVAIHATHTGPKPNTQDQTPRRDPGETFLWVSFGLSFLGLGAWGLWEGGWWIIPAILGVLIGLMCLATAMTRPKNQAPGSKNITEPA